MARPGAQHFTPVGKARYAPGVGTTKRLAPLLAAIIAVGSVTTASLAAPTAADKETARGLVRSGRTKKKQGDLDAAIEDFAAAHAIMNVPTTGTELGKAQLDHVEAHV